ncbi:MAG: hypothetical protein ABIA74_04270 [bacterium]
MLIDWEFFLEILFDLILFFLLVIVVHKLFVLYALPFLRQQIKEIKKQQENVKEKIKLLELSQNRLKFQILGQQNQFIDLGEKVKLWHKFVKNGNEETVEQRSKLIEKIKNKRDKQKELFCLFKLEKNVIVRAMDDIYYDLSPLHDKKKGRILLEELVGKISAPYKENGTN